MPSLKQLVDAVQAFMAEHPTALVTVVVDATFGHRIDPREIPEFDAAIDHNELVAPPAGAVGRGDAFVLAIADKVNASILSNDSYQEFHGEYPWLFDEGRLIGGKPVPHVGWVFVPRVPVRGPLSRRSQREAKQKDRPTGKAAAPRRASKAASQPLPVPATPPPGAVVAAKGAGRGRKQEQPAEAAPSPATKVDVPTPAKSTMVNDLLPFITFVEHHPVGTAVTAVVESYSSHGAYVTVGDARAYLPLRYMADPPPRSARELMKVGDEVALVVVAFHASRRGIDLAVPSMAPTVVATAAMADAVGAPAPSSPAPAQQAPAKRARRAAAKATDEQEPPVVAEPPAAKASRRKKGAEPAVTEPAPAPAPAKRGGRAATKVAQEQKQAPPVAVEPAATKSSRRRTSATGEAATDAPPAPAAAKRGRRAALKAVEEQEAPTAAGPAATKAPRRRSKQAEPKVAARGPEEEPASGRSADAALA